MAVLYNKKTGKLFKNCNCGGALPSYTPIIFRYGDADSLSDNEFTSLITKRRRDERSLQREEQQEFRLETTRMRNERRTAVSKARNSGMRFGDIYYSTQEIVDELGDAIYIMTEEDLSKIPDNLSMREYKPRNRRF